ncbi:MAG: AAA family ATPase, partial [Treponema sp.]|nr:AAA family ATPase [Treponema sp.]
MEQKLPIGIQDFVKIREGGYCYVDKTARIHDLITGSGGVFFLSRPRRFGKSLLCSTLGALFEGRRELFGAVGGRPPLAVDSLDWEWKKYPVIRMDLNPGNYALGIDQLTARLHGLLAETAQAAGLPLRGGTIVSEQFYSLIRDMAEQAGERVVVIIDEYDKPLLS